jgi:hypothetical protein
MACSRSCKSGGIPKSIASSDRPGTEWIDDMAGYANLPVWRAYPTVILYDSMHAGFASLNYVLPPRASMSAALPL